jgi:uncharacterized protein (TIGR02301 family)
MMARASIRRLLRVAVALPASLIFGFQPPAVAQENPMRPTIVQPAQPRGQPQPQRPAQPQTRRPTQSTPSATAEPRPGDPPKPDETRKLGPPPIYEKQLVELSEAMGSLAFLTGLCSPTPEPNAWQKRMDGLLESEGEVTTTREKMIGAYNQGFIAFQTSHRQCSEASKAARALLVRDAARIARDLERRYGG